LPIAEDIGGTAPSPETAPQDAAPNMPNALTVLVVDDDALVSMGTSAMLEDLGHVTTEASSAAAALEILNSGRRFDLVITDHAMPGMTGAELARLIIGSYPGLPVILASGYVELHEDHGLSDLLRMTKPFTQEQLQTAVHRAVAERASAA
jgi:CheY-like chemotaxis protein